MTWLDDYLLRKQIVVAGFILDGASVALQVGDWFCVSPTDTSGGTVTKAVPAALASAGSALGIAVESAQPGQPVRGICVGMVPRIVSGLSTFASPTPVRIDANARSERFTGTGGVGFADVTGTITISASQAQTPFGQPKDPVRMATTANLAATRSGNVLTATSNGVAPTIDGVSQLVGERILVKDQSTGADNGIYTWTSLGSGGTPYVLTRATDADDSSEVRAGMRVICTEGTVNGDKEFVLTTNDPITLNTTALAFAALSALGIPGGSDGNVQFKNGASFAGASGISVVATGTALAFGTTFAQNSGLIRVAHATTIITSRNSTSDGDILILRVGANGNNSVSLGGEEVTGGLFFRVPSGVIVTFSVNNISEYTLSSSVFDVLDNAIRFGTNPAAGGLTRFPNNATIIAARNFANSADQVLLSTDVSNSFVLGENTNVPKIVFRSASGGTYEFLINNVLEYVLGANEINLKSNNLLQENVADASAVTLRVGAAGSTSGNANGGRARFTGGRRAGTGNYGGAVLQLNQDDSTFYSMVEVVHLGNARRIVGLCKPTDVTTTDMPTATGDLVVFVGNTATGPSAAPANGAILFANAGALSCYTTGNFQEQFTAQNGGSTAGTSKLLARRENRVQTTNATQTLATFVALPNSSIVGVEAWAVARQDGTNQAGYHLRAVVSQEGGTAALIGTVDQLAREDQAAWDATITVSGNEVRVSVTGAAATTIEWWAYMKVYIWQP